MTTEQRIIEKIAALENRWRLLFKKLDGLQRSYILESRVDEKLRLETLIRETKEELLRAENQLSDLESKIGPISNQPSIANLRKNDLEKGEPISIFYSYSHEDESFRQILETHLSLLKRQGIISDWHDRRIAAGVEWQGSIDQYVERAQLILLLISADYLASDYCYDIEMRRALERHESHEARVIPIILRPVDWSGGPFSKLQALPRDGKPVTSWPNRDEAFLDIVSSIRQVCYDILTQKNLETKSEKIATAETFFALEEVFLSSGIPSITFVEPLKFKELKSVLKQPSRGVVIEGPSGIGKTTALVKAANAVLKDFDRNRNVYSARDPQKIEKLETLHDWHKGIIVIDDFHRLAQDHESLRNNIIDYLKYLADIKAPDKKLVIIGIPKTGRHLVELSPDIATRIRVFPLTKVPPYIVLEMINKGEMALNIRFDKKEDIANRASGSLNIAQILCYYVALSEDVERTQKTTKLVRCNLDNAIRNAQEIMELKFEKLVKLFSSLGTKDDDVCINLLKELSDSEDGSISLLMVREELSKGISNFLSKNYIGDLQEKFSEYDNFIFFDEINCELTIDDPQLAFYLQNTSVRSLYKFGGKFPDKYQAKSAKYSSNSKKKLVEKPNHNTKHRASYDTKLYTEVTKSINNIKILHLSDIYLNTRSQAELYFSQLKADLIQELKVSKLDYVVISGDIANCSKSEEYDAAILIIDGLINQFSLDSSNFIIIVTGNHDLNWDLSKNAYLFKYKDSLPKPLIEGSYVPAGDTGALLREEDLYKKRFDYFRDFYKKICGSDFPLEYADQAVLHIYPRNKIIFLALNSCWEIDHYYRNRASINSSALARALDKIVLSEYQDWLKIAVWHHPINGTESISDSFIERLAISGFKIGMHGHIHEARDSYLMYDVNRGIHVIGSGTFGAPIKEQVPGIPLQYNLI